MQDKGKIVLNSVWQMSIIFVMPLILFLLLREFVFSKELQTNKILNIFSVFSCYILSWVFFALAFYPRLKNEVKKNIDNDIKIEKINKEKDERR